MTKNVILYHNHCDDGFGAAWSAWKKFGSKAKYIGVTYNEPVPKGLEGKNVYILDFCYSPRVIKNLLKITNKLVVIDHHISNRKATELVPEHVFDSIKHSGAYLTWQYFYPKNKMPKLIKYIDDVDLWKWKLSYSRELSSFIRSYDRDFTLWNKFAKNFENSKHRKKYIEEGKAILRANAKKVKHAVEEAELVEFSGYKTLASNSFHLVSYIGGKLCEKLPPIGIIWSRRNGVTVVSLRSNGKVDVSKLAEKFGGGGHRASSAFELSPNEKLPWKVISDNIS